MKKNKIENWFENDSSILIINKQKMDTQSQKQEINQDKREKKEDSSKKVIEKKERKPTRSLFAF